MRLKFLFFPVMLVVSISIFFGYIWPEIGSLKDANLELLKNKEDMQTAQNKQLAIEKISTQMNQDIDGEKMINNYLPNAKAEERIISGVNFLANDAGVSLANISLKDAPSAADPSLMVGSTAAALSAAANPVAQADIVVASTPQAAQSDKTDGFHATQALIVINGEYDNIKLFLDQLQRLPMYNVIRSLKISAVQKVAGDATAVDQAKVASLSANVVVDFGYLSPIKISNDKVSNFKPEIDSTISNALKQYISQKAPSVENLGDKNGKSNPFQL